jgi:hypothetical protein
MSKWDSEKGMRFDMPASYCIEIQGYLDASWSDRLAGMHISTCQGENQAPVATLTGRVRDQAELAGVLDTLYEMHLVLLKLEIIDGE